MRVSRLPLLSVSVVLLGLGAACRPDGLTEPPSAEHAVQALTAGWTAAPSMPVARGQHATVLLGDGRVLAVGGVNGTGFVTTAEVLDPARGTWTSLGDSGVRGNVTIARLLNNGKVLVLSDGSRDTRVLDIASNTSTSAVMSSTRSIPSVTTLADGRVLVAGGAGAGGVRLTTAELYDPVTNTFTATGSMQEGRGAHVAARLHDGRVLVVSGFNQSTQVTSAELYDPATGTWTMAAPPLVPRHYASATTLVDGRVLVTGGAVIGGVTAQSEIYDPASNTWTATGSLGTPRNGHTATLLPSGRLVVAGGSSSTQQAALASVETYDPATGLWSPAPSLQAGRENASATLLPTGRVLVLGGYTRTPGLTFLTSAEVLEPAADAWTPFAAPTVSRVEPHAALLPDGDLLLVGGRDGNGPLPSAQRFDTATAAWAPSVALVASHAAGTLSALGSGDLLAVGGGEAGAAVSTVERYSSATGAWSLVAPLPAPRRSHTSTVLADGRVLVVGGEDLAGAAQPHAYVYDPAANAWSEVAAPAARKAHGAVRLAGGQVLIVGGIGAAGATLASAQLYDPATNTWSSAAALATARFDATYTVLASGRVLAAGGRAGAALASTEIYDASTNTWSTAGALPVARFGGRSALVADGSVLVAGGETAPGVAATTSSLFDELTSRWQDTSAGTVRRGALVVLPAGDAVALGGDGAAAAQRYTRAARRSWQPTVTGPDRVHPGCVAELTGTGLRGISEGSAGGYTGSPTDHPLVQLRGDARAWRLTASRFDSEHARFTVPVDVPRGHYALGVLVSGVPAGRMVEVLPNTPPRVDDRTATVAPGGSAALTLEATDPDLGQELSWELVTEPVHGTLTGTLPNVTYAAEEGYLGSDSFTVRATDSCGLASADATVAVTIADAPPVLACPQPQTLEATSSAGAAGAWPDAVAEGEATIAYEPERGTVLPLGATTVTSTATSASGIDATCTFVVTVRDTIPPTVTCPADLRVAATSASGARVDYAPARASDRVTEAPTVVSAPASGSEFRPGATTVTATATDAAGNVSQCTFVVTVDAPSGADAGSGAGEEQGDGAGGGDGGGCACDTRGRATTPWGAWALGLVALVTLRLRGRRGLRD